MAAASDAPANSLCVLLAETMMLASANPTLKAPVLSHGDAIRVGLVNNMPDAALRATEWQVRDLLARAAGDLPVALAVFSLATVPRTDTGRRYVEEHHTPIAELWTQGVDGLIVTGTEPRAAALQDEPYWTELSQLIRWAEENTISTAWSCLAAHAAAYLLDRIARKPLPAKLIGVFECEKVSDHRLTANRPVRWSVPHSRQNELPKVALMQAGYHILSESPQAGVDIFVREQKSLFVFLQGHPEYDANALFGEYRRDVRRYLNNELAPYPELPYGYFSGVATKLLLAFRERALSDRHPSLLDHFPAEAAGQDIAMTWRESAAHLYSNWLGYLFEKRATHHRTGRPIEPRAVARLCS